MADALSLHALLIIGPYGAGKSSLAAELADLLEHRGTPYAAVDLDWLWWYEAGQRPDEARDLLLRNLKAVVGQFREAGVRSYLLAGSVAEPLELDEIRAVLDMPLTVVRLVVPLEELIRRLTADVTTGRQDDLRRAREQVAAGEGIGLEDFALENRGPIREVAEDVLHRVPALAGATSADGGPAAAPERVQVGPDRVSAARPDPTGETLISVDVEASGPTPSTGSLLAIGACLVDDPETGFYREIRPLPDRRWEAEAEAVHRLTREHLMELGVEPEAAMADLVAWVDRESSGRRPVFVGFNAPFDWMFVADAFHRYLGHNPFGISGLDLKALYMGRHGVERWSETTRVFITRRLGLSAEMSHNALDDARSQAQICRLLLDRGVSSAPDDR